MIGTCDSCSTKNIEVVCVGYGTRKLYQCRNCSEECYWDRSGIQ